MLFPCQQSADYQMTTSRAFNFISFYQNYVVYVIKCSILMSPENVKCINSQEHHPHTCETLQNIKGRDHIDRQYFQSINNKYFFCPLKMRNGVDMLCSWATLNPFQYFFLIILFYSDNFSPLIPSCPNKLSIPFLMSSPFIFLKRASFTFMRNARAVLCCVGIWTINQ